MAHFLYFFILLGVFSLIRLFAWRFFRPMIRLVIYCLFGWRFFSVFSRSVFLLFRHFVFAALSYFRFFAFLLFVISSFCVAFFRLSFAWRYDAVKIRKNTPHTKDELTIKRYANRKRIRLLKGIISQVDISSVCARSLFCVADCVISSFRLALFRLFVFSCGFFSLFFLSPIVFSSIHVASFLFRLFA